MANKKKEDVPYIARNWDKLPQAEKNKALADATVQLMEEDLNLPYSKEHYIANCKNLLRQTAENIIMIGKMLLIIKQKEEHGEFLKIVTDELGLTPRSAQRFMNVALKAEKFKRIKFTKFEKVSHVYALLEAPEEDLEELDKKGVLAGKTMDELDAMSVKEMRELIRKLKHEKDKIVEEETKNLKLEKEALLKEVERLKQFDPEPNPPEYIVNALQEAMKLYNEFESVLRKIVLDPVILDHPEVMAKAEGIIGQMFLYLNEFKDAYMDYVTLGYEEPVPMTSWVKYMPERLKKANGEKVEEDGDDEIIDIDKG